MGRFKFRSTSILLVHETCRALAAECLYTSMHIKQLYLYCPSFTSEWTIMLRS